MAKYSLEKMTATSMATTEAAWQSQLGSAPEAKSWTAYEVWLEFFQRGVAGEVSRGDGVGEIYGVFEESSPDEARALLNLNKPLGGKQKNSLRLMDLCVSPGLDVSGGPLDEDQIVELSWVAATAITGTMDMLLKSAPIKQLKVYIDVPFSKELMTGIATAMAMASKQVPLKVHHEGKWLVVSKV